MNKRYRVLFNEHTQTYTAVAENAPSRAGKGSAAKTALVATAVSLGTTTIAYASWVGSQSGGIIMTNGAYVDTTQMNTDSNVLAGQAKGANSIALGTDNSDPTGIASAGHNSIAIGKGANAAYYALDTNGNPIIGFDPSATLDTAGTDATAIGNNTYAASHSVAIGSGSHAFQLRNNELSGRSVSMHGDTYDFAAANRTHTFSVGSQGNERVVTNVAAGKIDATSTHAVNGSQLYAAYESIKDISDDVKVNTTNINQLQNQTWQLGVNGEQNPVAVNPNSVVNFKEGGNIAITRNGTDISIDTKPVVTFDHVNVGPVVISKDTGINAGNNKITHVADGLVTSNSQDAINGSQLYALENQTWHLDVNGSGASKIGKSDVVSFKDGDNIAISRDGNNITVATKANVNFDQVSVGNVILNRDTGINAGGHKITNVAAGAINATSTDAINGSQLYTELGKIQTTVNHNLTWDLIADNSSGTSTTKQIGIDTPLQIKGDGQTTKAQLSSDASGNPVLTVSAASPIQYVDASGQASADQFVPTDTVALVGANGTQDPVKLTNVKEGTIAADSKDAVNGGQIHHAGSSIGDIIGGGASFENGAIVWNNDKNGDGTPDYNGIGNTGETTIHDAIASLNSQTQQAAAGWDYSIDGQKQGQVKPTSTFDFKGKTNTIAGEDYQNIIVEKSLSGNGIQIGLADDISVNTLTAKDAITVGDTTVTSQGGNLQIGQGTITSGRTGSIGLGKDYTINADNSLALGNGSVADAPVATGGITIRGDDYAFAGAKPVGTVSVGSKDNERTVSHVAAGRVTADSTDAVNGSQLHATNQAVEKIQNGGAGVVQYANSETPTTPNGGKPTNTATLVGADNNAPVTLTNVAAGTAPTDAVNVSQLNQVKGDIQNVDKRASAGTAAAMATGLLNQAFDPGSSIVSISAANFDGEQGYAVGYSALSDGGKWLVRAAGTGNSQEKYGVGASVGYRWN